LNYLAAVSPYRLGISSWLGWIIWMACERCEWWRDTNW